MGAQEPLREFRKKFRLDELMLLESEHWNLSLRPAQLTLGSMILSAASPALSFSDLSQTSGVELVRILSMAERIAKECFGAAKVNFMCLMMVDPHLHFHVFPRYAREIRFGNVVWSDEDWPLPLKTLAGDSEKDEVLFAIRDFIRGKI